MGEWILTGRVAEAARRLAHTEDSLDEITHHVGWQDKTHFIRQFRKSLIFTWWNSENRMFILLNTLDIEINALNKGAQDE